MKQRLAFAGVGTYHGGSNELANKHQGNSQGRLRALQPLKGSADLAFVEHPFNVSPVPLHSAMSSSQRDERDDFARGL
jgi:hypothetical protein